MFLYFLSLLVIIKNQNMGILLIERNFSYFIFITKPINMLTSRILLLNKLTTYNKHRGFTLIELLVVIIIIGILSAISIPNFITQIGKARETEAKNMLGAIARSQQAYHFEKQVFADSLSKLSLSGTFASKYYNAFDPTDVSDLSIRVKHQAIPSDPLRDRVRNYAIAVYYNAGLFEIAFCQAIDVNQPVDAPDVPSDSCTNGGIRLE
jgi:type IV pilus assembly protein PilA